MITGPTRADGSAEMAPSGVLRSYLAWDLVFWFLLLVTALSVYLVSGGTGNWYGLLGVLAGLGASYQLLGRRAIRTREPWAIRAYCVILVIGTGVASALVPDAAFMLFFAMPQLWHLGTGWRHGLFFNLLVLVVVGLGLMSNQGFTTEHLVEMLPWMLISLALTLVLGVSVDRVVEKSEERAALIRELEVARDELAEAHHAAGVAAERERMAREIHDTLAQGFTSIVMLAQAARSDRSAEHRILAQIEDTARENLAEARALLAAFAPVALDGSTLVDALRRLGERFARETGVAVDVRLGMTEAAAAAIPAPQQVVLLRAAQEALANVRKHAGAAHVVVELARRDGVAEIDIVDDGRGFDVGSIGTTGFGLAAMRGRVEESGGSVELDSAPGRGTRVQVQVPAPLTTDGAA